MIFKFFIISFFILIIGVLLFFLIKKGKQIIPLFVIAIIGFLLVLDLMNDGYVAQIFSSIGKSEKEQVNYYIEKDDDVDIIKIEKNVLIDAPIIDQFPELPRGCEVTSLAMLLQHVDIDVDKMTLAEEVIKDPTPYDIIGGEIHFGHPNVGFVGNMYTYDKPGLGVYHKPIKALADQYLPGKIIDLTGSQFDELKIHLSAGRPVWVIINTAYEKLPKSYFQTWKTTNGEIEITYKEHSVLVTGYDEQYVYFNDPLIAKKNRQESIEGFEDAWIQMGRQAITYLP